MGRFLFMKFTHRIKSRKKNFVAIDIGKIPQIFLIFWGILFHIQNLICKKSERIIGRRTILFSHNKAHLSACKACSYHNKRWSSNCSTAGHGECYHILLP